MRSEGGEGESEGRKESGQRRDGTNAFEDGEGEPGEEHRGPAGEDVERPAREALVGRPEAVGPQAEVGEEDEQEGKVEP